MYAPQPSRSPNRSRRSTVKPASVQRRSPQHMRSSHQEVTVEVGIKLAVNLTLAVVALAYAGRLLSYNLTQEKKLESLKAEVAAVDERVSGLRDEFSIQFDTHQTQQLIRQQRHRISPNQMQVIWTDPPASAPTSDIEAPSAPAPTPDATVISSQP